MKAEVAVGRVDLRISGAPASSGSPHALVRAVMNALERELDAALVPTPELIVIPRIDIDICLDAADVSSLAEAIARRIASHITTVARRGLGVTARMPSREAGILARSDRSDAEERLRWLLDAARGLACGAPPRAVEEQVARSATPAEELWRDDAPGAIEDPTDWIDEVMTANGQVILDLLGRVARQKQLRHFMRALACRAAEVGIAAIVREWLSRIHGALSAGFSRRWTTSAMVRAEAARRLEAAEARALERLSTEDPGTPFEAAELTASPMVRLLLALAEEGRLLRQRIARTPALAEAVLEAIAALGVAPRAAGADRPADEKPPRNALVRLDQARLRDPSGDFMDPLFDTTFTHAAPFADHSRNQGDIVASALLAVSPDEDGDPRIPSAAAGLAFLIRPLLDLGWHEALTAVRDEPTLFLASVLRRILEIEGAPRALLADPATWLVAGLLDEPSDDDLAADAATWDAQGFAAIARAAGGESTTPEGARDAWARATIAEANLRLQDTRGADDLLNDVILVSGAIVAADDGIEVFFPFTDSYEALLRAGLLMDVPSVPWLGGRPLRFVFEGPEYGGPI